MAAESIHFRFVVVALYLYEQLCFLWRLIKVKSREVARNEREIGCDSEDVAQRPSLEKIKCDIGVELEQRLERDQSSSSIPVRFVLEARFGPAIEKVFRDINGAGDAVIGYVYCLNLGGNVARRKGFLARGPRRRETRLYNHVTLHV
jgi:hypothetical protein